jgi:hypothetical protein
MDRAESQKQSSYVLIFAFVMAVLVMTFIAYFGGNRPGSPQEILAYALAAVALVGALVLAQAKLTVPNVIGGDEDLPTPREFLASLVLCLAIAEFGALSGFVFVGLYRPSAFVPFAVVTVVFYVLFLLPKSTAYWSALEEQSQSRIGSRNSDLKQHS